MNRAARNIGLALTATALSAGLWACGGGSDDGTTSAPATAAAADTTTTAAPTTDTGWAAGTPAATGDLDAVTWALPYGEPATLNWLQAAAYSENTVLAPLCESLLKITPELEYAPALAEKVDHPDAKTYVYHLRDGVTFTDGKPMTSADVVYSLSRNLDPKAGSFWSGWYANVASIKATDASTVTVKLKQPDVLFNEFMATAAGTVAEKAYVEKQGDAYGTPKGGVMCTGPYQLDSWKTGQSITISRNDAYWDTADKAKTKQITFQFLTNPSTLASALKTGEVDGTYEAPITTVDGLTGSTAGKLTLGNSTELSLMSFTVRPGPVQDVRIRKALSMAMDRSGIAKTIFKGTAAPTFSPLVPATWGYAKETFAAEAAKLPDPTQTDVEGAKALVQEVGDVRPLKVLVNADDPAAMQLATYVQAQGKTIGIPIDLEALPAAQQIASAFDPEQQKKYDMLVQNTGYIDVPDPLAWVYMTLVPGGPFNTNAYDNAKVSKLAEEARGTDDPQKRAELIGQIAQQAYGVDYSMLTLANFAERLFLNGRVTGVPASLPSYIYSPWASGLGAAG
jgi:peptide/nickel transport system substrate-binding protein